MVGAASGVPVVIGVGNDYRGDDGAGPAVVAVLRDLMPDSGGVRLALCDGEPARMIDLWRDAALAVVIDAARADREAGAVPGDVLCWEAGAGGAEPPIGSDAANSHALGPGEALRLAAVLDRLPRRLLVFAVVGSDFGVGARLSDPVAAAVARVADDVVRELRREGLSARGDGSFGPCPKTPWTERVVP
jgi:hydrogenase maturation protease